MRYKKIDDLLLRAKEIQKVRSGIACIMQCKPAVVPSKGMRWRIGAGGGTRTHTTLPSRDFKSLASTSSATSALVTRSET